MAKRFLAIWFRYLKTDWFIRRQQELSALPFVLAAPSHGKMIVTAANKLAQAQGIELNMALADARAIIPALQVADDKPGLSDKLLKGIAEWCIRYTPVAAVDMPDGIILDITGCAHLWGGEKTYLQSLGKRLQGFGYTVRAAIADTIGAAWAVSRYGQITPLIEQGEQLTALLPLPPAALRLDYAVLEQLHKLGFRTIRDFIDIPRKSLSRRFGKEFIQQLDKALGNESEAINPVLPAEICEERLPCLEPIVTATGIEIALQRLMEQLCGRLIAEQKGLRTAIFKCYRIDGKMEKIEIGTNRPSSNAAHLFKLFETKIESIEPASGIELFVLEAVKVEDNKPAQERLWQSDPGLNDNTLAELLDRVSNKFGPDHIHRYVPEEHYWPERSFRIATSLNEVLPTYWREDVQRPLHILSNPLPIQVAAPIPDYPPMHFRYKGTLHKVIKADGPERIEQEWWLQQGQHRDYYCVEDEQGQRYWLFRSGHYTDESYQWFIHGFFA